MKDMKELQGGNGMESTKGTTRDRVARAPSLWLAAAALACGLLPAAGPAAAAQETAGRWAPAAAPCTSEQLIANSAQRIGGTQVRITVINDGPGPCVLAGYPTVALAGQGSPDRNKPLHVIRQGQARAVHLAVGGRASTQLTFTPVLGEADGYCASGAGPTVAPSIVLGVGGGGFQLAPDDGGLFALCGTTVQATAFRGSRS
ncbi:DUF4232 domain-containing protein [Streptomyces sp. ISL-66]|uniref:DUF4232 domain-containing protein n=1 Tax=Streptomyces sp. ISL-66 TaxID=2819186 RepID=UPI001BE6CA86|nr:DUF4232 domain-containing protein [Streptomyces sp. ISL-66]MBT2469993.1 DUF4232 domain-containing protein [Streptomyces sp. ISL-66]